MTTVPGLERLSRVTPFGVRFVDDQGGRVVGDGLRARAWPTAEPSRVVPLRLNGTNVHYVLDAPGLRDLGFGAGDDAYWSAVRRVGFTVEVADLAGRFLPFRFTADLPRRGLMRLDCGSPLGRVPLPAGAESDGVPLFSSPSRPATPGTVILRAELWDAVSGTPAAWAVLNARTVGAALRGEPPRQAIADERGRVALHFPIPDERDFEGGSFDSPSGSSGASLGARTWLVEVTAAYGHLLPAPDTASESPPPIPDLCAALAQPAARLWDRLGSSALALGSVTMKFGQETFLKSSDTGAAPASVLLVTPSSPP